MSIEDRDWYREDFKRLQAINDRSPEQASDRAQFILAVQKAANQAFRQGMWFGVFIGLVTSWGVPRLLDFLFR